MANCGNMHTCVTDKNVALYLGNPQRHALNRIHCKKKKKTPTELITTTLTDGRTFFSCSCIILHLFIGSCWFPGQKVTAILMAFEVLSWKKKASCTFWKLTLLNWHILISTFLKRISRLHYIHFRVTFHNICTYALKKKKKSCSLNTRTRKAQFSLHLVSGVDSRLSRKPFLLAGTLLYIPVSLRKGSGWLGLPPLIKTPHL